MRPPLFASFWMGGYESACHINRQGRRLDMIAATQHDRFVRDDYRRLKSMNMRVARDTVRWHLIESRPGVFDFSSLEDQARASRNEQIQVVWDLCHYGWPDDVDVFSAAFPERFARFCAATARYLGDHTEGVPWYTPMNEISFLTWAAGDVAWFYPFGRNRGGELKRQLVRAAIAAIEALRTVDRRARTVTVEPLINVVPPLGKPDVDDLAARYHESQFEAWDMLAGRLAPELGGHPSYLDVIGVNFYHDNQWEHPGGEKIHWHIKPRDPRWVPFSTLLESAYERYQRPIFIAETSHVGIGRAEWITEMSTELVRAVRAGVPLEGVCLYPVINRFEWENPRHWHDSGLWDFDIQPDGTYARVLNAEYAAAVIDAQRRLAEVGCGSEPDEIDESDAVNL